MRAFLFGLALVMGAGLLAVGSARADPPLPGTCSVSPDPNPQYGTYTVTGDGADPGAFLNVLVSDSVGTTVLFASGSASGAYSVSALSYWAGTSQVEVRRQQQSGHFKPIARCSFVVV